MERLGFVGLGIMGRAMARNLLRAGFALTVYNRSPEKALPLEAEGAAVASSPAEVARRSDIVFAMVPDAPDVEDVLFGQRGAAEGMRAGMLFVDCSAIDPGASRAFSARLAAKGVDMLDAPVSGGEVGAIERTLSFMVGGEEAAFQRALPALNAMGASAVLCGGAGAGNVTKLASQIVVAGNLMVLGEALVFAEKAGVRSERVFQAIRGGFAGSRIMELKARNMIDGDFEPGGKLKFMIKDGENALRTAEAAGAAIPMMRTILDAIYRVCEMGHGDDDHSALVRYYEQLAGIRLGDGRATEEEI